MTIPLKCLKIYIKMKNLRKYGKSPYKVAVVHGGPGAPGEMAPVARELSSICGILEPLQTAQTVDGQVEELKSVIKENSEAPIILAGFSWGAWLCFILTARYPSLVKKLILVSSGPFEDKYAENIMITRFNRLDDGDRASAFKVIDTLNDPATKDRDKLMPLYGELMSKADYFDPIPHDPELLAYQWDINQSVLNEAARMRTSGELLELGKKIICPVVAIHGDYDPHIAEGVKEPLSRILKDFRFILLEKCGHCPWQEKFAKDRFYDILKGEIE